MTSAESTSQQRRPRGEYAKSKIAREAILDAALQVFATSGYRKGSLREIADRVGMSEAGLLHHFRNKSSLLAAVLDRRDQLSLEFVPDAPDDPLDVLRGMVALAAKNATTPGVVELYCTISAEATTPDHPAHEYFRRRYERTRERIAHAFSRLRDEGRMSAALDPMGAAITTIALMDGLQVQWLLDNSSVDMAAQLGALFAGMGVGDI